MKISWSKNITFKDYLLVTVLVVIICLTAHFTLIDRLAFWRLIYPIQAQLSVWSISCSNDTPTWLNDSLKFIIRDNKILTNQIAYIDSKGEKHTCQSGWTGDAVISSKLLENTRFRYASNTKIITHVAILKLINSRKIKIDDKLISFFPELENQKFKDDNVKNITISDLLQHRSGFDRMRSEDVVFSTNKKPWCPYHINKLTSIKLDFMPNERYAYDNRNSCLLGLIIERVTKQSYRSYINTHLIGVDSNIKFVDGPYFSDEVKYDFRNSDFWMESDNNKFNWDAISSSAGLSGSAKDLAQVIYSLSKLMPTQLLGIEDESLDSCYLEKFESCNGYIFWQYQKDKENKKMYFRNGELPGVTSLVVITDNQEIFVWVGNGVALNTLGENEYLIESYIYNNIYEN